jgi:hypothetical protein
MRSWYRFGTDCFVQCVQIVHAGDDRDAADAQGRIYITIGSAGGRKVVGSNPTAPADEEPLDLQRFLAPQGVWTDVCEGDFGW